MALGRMLKIPDQRKNPQWRTTGDIFVTGASNELGTTMRVLVPLHADEGSPAEWRGFLLGRKKGRARIARPDIWCSIAGCRWPVSADSQSCPGCAGTRRSTA